MVKLAVFAALLGCHADFPSKGPDASGGGAFGQACATVTDTSTECATGVCTDSIDMAGHPVCSEKCTTGNDATCPLGSTGVAFCNGKGYCKP